MINPSSKIMKKFKNHKNNSNCENELQLKYKNHLYCKIIFVTIHFLGTLMCFSPCVTSQPY